MRGLRVASILLVGALALTGCGGDDDDDEAADDTTTTVEEDSGSEGDDGGDSGDEGDDGESGDSAGAVTAERCAEAVQAMAAAASAVPGSLSGQGGEFRESIEQLEAFADAAPGEIRDDLRLIAAAYARLAEALEEAGIEPGETPSADQLRDLQEMGEELDDEDLQSASERVNSWFEEECGR